MDLLFTSDDTKIKAMQAENATDQMDWIEKITGVIASLLSAQTLDMVHCRFFFSSASLEGRINFDYGSFINNYMAAFVS